MWPTPTPYPVGTPSFPMPVDPTEFTSSITEWVLQGWNTFNSSPFAAVIWFGLMLLVIYFGVQSIRHHLENL